LRADIVHFFFRQAAAWAKERRLAEGNEWKSMFVSDRAKSSTIREAKRR